MHVLLRRLEIKYHDIMVLLGILLYAHAQLQIVQVGLLIFAYYHLVASILKQFGKSPLRVCDICFKNVLQVNEKVKHANED